MPAHQRRRTQQQSPPACPPLRTTQHHHCMTNTRQGHTPVQPSYSAQPEVNRDDRPPSRPDASPQEGARGPRAGKAVPLRALPGGRRASTPHRPSTGPPLYRLGEVSRGSGSREPPGERLSHMWCRRMTLLRHHMCERRLSTRLPSRSPTGAPSSSGRPTATVGSLGVLHLLVLQETQQSPPITKKKPLLIAGRLQISRSPIESVNTSRQLQRPSIAPPPRLRRCVRKLRPQALKHRSNSVVKH